jgi:hypothetical protein
MKGDLAVRDTLYKSIDNLISFYLQNDQKLPFITLDSAQFKIFTQFNEPVEDKYYYKKIVIRGKS